MSENKIVYLFGSGATQSEISIAGLEVDTTTIGINSSILEESRRHGGFYYDFHNRFGLTPEIDVEQLMSFFEIFDEKYPPEIQGLHDELRMLYRNYLIENIDLKGIEPRLLMSLLHLHRHYGKYMGENGETLIGIMTINFDSLTEEAVSSLYDGINLGVEFQSDEYKEAPEAPLLLKLHGSFNWKIKDGEMQISRGFIDSESEDVTGWITPSIYKKPYDLPIFKEIWSNAADLLRGCDRLRIVGSSIRSEDFALISLLFTCQLLNDVPFDIELIVSDRTSKGDEDKKGIIERLSYLTNLKPLSELIDIPMEQISSNVFYHWLEDAVNKIEQTFSDIMDDDFIREKLYGEKTI